MSLETIVTKEVVVNLVLKSGLLGPSFFSYLAFIDNNKIHFNALNCSSKRYWLLLFLTLVMNIIVIVSYRAPSPNTSTPTLPEFIYAIVPLLIYIVGGVHTFFAGWMAMEYLILTGPHFVLPKFLYRINIIPDKFNQYRLTAWMTR